jgi:5-oxoprolinase (ATP-hydrolysing)
MTATILSSHRQIAPYGLAGGEPGKKGENSVLHPDNTITLLAGNDEVFLSSNDIFIIKTPGGGGYGKPNKYE